MSTSFPFFSVVIATKNEEENIEVCLRSLRNQTLPKKLFEIVLVDCNSSDKTRILAKKFTDKVYNLPDVACLEKVKNFRGAQINYGVRKSGGNIIFFPDSDMTFENDLLEEAAKLVTINKFDALFVPEIVLGKGLFGEIRNFERSFYNGTCIDGIRIVKKTLFTKINGFDEKNIQFGLDDWDFTKRAKKMTNKISISTKKLYHHEELLDLRRYLDKKSKYTDAVEGYVKKWGKSDADVKKQLGFLYRYFTVFFEDGKWVRLIRNPKLTFGMYILKILIGLRYVMVKK